METIKFFDVETNPTCPSCDVIVNESAGLYWEKIIIIKSYLKVVENEENMVEKIDSLDGVN
jgi:hypothetical protein